MKWKVAISQLKELRNEVIFISIEGIPPPQPITITDVIPNYLDISYVRFALQILRGFRKPNLCFQNPRMAQGFGLGVPHPAPH